MLFFYFLIHLQKEDEDGITHQPKEMIQPQLKALVDLPVMQQCPRMKIQK